MHEIWKLSARTFRAAGWAPLTVLIAHHILARMFGHEPFVDPVMHFSGGAAAALVVRYAWSPRPVWANLFNSAGLPAVTFRTDDWDDVP